MKKLLLILLIALLILPLGGCALLDLFSNVVSPTPGVWEEDVFVSEYLGLRFLMPFGWTELDASEHAAIAAAVESAFDADDGGKILDTMVMCHITTSNIQIAYTPYGRRAPSAEDFIDATQRELEASMDAHVTPGSGTTTIAGQQWYSIASEVEMFGYTISQGLFFNMYEGYIRTITITTYNPDLESPEDFLHLFVGLDDPLPPRPLLAGSSALFGLWEWDQDLGFVHEFHSDGSGARGWIGQTEEFLWYVLDDSLYIVTPNITEHWAFTIAGGILTMDSRQEAGLTWNYIATVDVNTAENTVNASELIGTWEWDVDATFSLTLNANGTGARGFSDDLEHFEWTTIDDNLLIDTPLMLESWTFTIVGNVLTIDSRQAPGLTWSYIAR